MGEVRTPVQLTSSFDEMRMRRGELADGDVKRCEVDGLVDTGAVRSVLPIYVVEKLGLKMRGKQLAEYADGRQEIVDTTEPVVFEIMGRETLEEALVLGDEVLIGQTILEKLDLLADCANHRLVPNPDHPDQPVSRVK